MEINLEFTKFFLSDSFAEDIFCFARQIHWLFKESNQNIICLILAYVSSEVNCNMFHGSRMKTHFRKKKFCGIGLFIYKNMILNWWRGFLQLDVNLLGVCGNLGCECCFQYYTWTENTLNQTSKDDHLFSIDSYCWWPDRLTDTVNNSTFKTL